MYRSLIFCAVSQSEDDVDTERADGVQIIVALGKIVVLWPIRISIPIGKNVVDIEDVVVGPGNVVQTHISDP